MPMDAEILLLAYEIARSQTAIDTVLNQCLLGSL
jgi:hypothetical protein